MYISLLVKKCICVCFEEKEDEEVKVMYFTATEAKGDRVKLVLDGVPWVHLVLHGI